MGIEDWDTCEVCSQRVPYCCCWRCLSCERLFDESVESGEDINGEPICEQCDNDYRQEATQ